MNYDIKCEHCGSKVSTSIDMIGYQTQCTICGAEFTIPLTNFSAGMVSGNYWLQKCIGTGNISQTFVAKRMDDNEKVFLKILSPCVTLVHEDVEQFMIEMCRSHQIDHPNLLSVYETGKMNGHYYLATRFVEGECLDKRIERTGPLSEKEALRLSLKIARILRSCWHDYGIVHRAIKPQNILVNDAGEVFLLDVGNCKQLLMSQSVPLERLDNLGTLGDYMSPEEAQGVVDVDCSSDIYSLGATLFFLMTGTKPYTGSDTTQVLLKHLNEPTPSITQRSGDVSKPTAKFIKAMMDSDPENRIFSWREVVGRLKKLLKGKTLGTGPDRVLKTQASTSTDFADEVRTSVMTPGPNVPQPVPVVKIAIIVIVVIVLLGVAGATAMIVMSKKPQDSPSVETGGADKGPQKTKTRDSDKGKSTSSRRRIDDNKFQARISAIEKVLLKGGNNVDRQVRNLNDMASETEDTKQLETINSLLARARGGTKEPPPTQPPKPPPVTPKDPTPKVAKFISVDKSELKFGNKRQNLGNADFEDTKFKPWKKEGSGKLQLKDTAAISGKLALEIYKGGGFVQRLNKVNVAKNTVTFTIWAMSDGQGEGVLELRFLKEDGSVINKATGKLVGGLAYGQSTVSAKAPAECKSLEIYVGY